MHCSLCQSNDYQSVHVRNRNLWLCEWSLVSSNKHQGKKSWICVLQRCRLYCFGPKLNTNLRRIWWKWRKSKHLFSHKHEHSEIFRRKQHSGSKNRLSSSNCRRILEQSRHHLSKQCLGNPKCLRLGWRAYRVWKNLTQIWYWKQKVEFDQNKNKPKKELIELINYIIKSVSFIKI